MLLYQILVVTLLVSLVIGFIGIHEGMIIIPFQGFCPAHLVGADFPGGMNPEFRSQHAGFQSGGALRIHMAGSIADQSHSGDDHSRGDHSNRGHTCYLFIDQIFRLKMTDYVREYGITGLQIVPHLFDLCNLIFPLHWHTSTQLVKHLKVDFDISVSGREDHQNTRW